jgi:hypothetical protein
MHGPGAYTHLCCNCPHGQTLGSRRLNTRQYLAALSWSAQPYSLRPRCGEARLYPVSYHGALKLREHAQHLEQGSPGRSGRIHCLQMEVQIHPCAMDLTKEAYKVL